MLQKRETTAVTTRGKYEHYKWKKTKGKKVTERALELGTEDQKDFVGTL